MSIEGKDSEKKNLEIRLTNIESMLNELVKSNGPISQIKASAEDVNLFQKVLRAAEADEWDGPHPCRHCLPTWATIRSREEITLQRIESMIERMKWWVECQPGWPGGGEFRGRSQFRDFGR